MKKLLLSLILLCICLQISKAQNIPNAGFENWTATGPFERPDNWDSSPKVSKSTDAHSGTYAIKLLTDTFTIPQSGNVDTIPGIINTGTQSSGPGNPGIKGYAFAARPDSLTGWFKYIPAVGDSFFIHVSFSKWNTTAGSRENICDAVFTGSSSNTYKRFSFPMHYLTSSLPDTAIIEISNTKVQPPAAFIIGTQLFIDDLQFKTNMPGGIAQNNSTENNITSTPNPATENLLITGLDDDSITIINHAGEVVKYIATKNSSSLQLNIHDLPAGNYLIRSNKGKVKKFSVIH